MDDIGEFARAILVVSGGLSLAIGVRVVAGRLALPTAGLLLVVAAVTSGLVDRVASILTFEDVQRVATLALIVILFEGGQKIGLGRFKQAAVPILTLGVVGTFATAALLAVAAHALFDLSWTVSGLIGAALAPTDPAVTFSVLAGKEVEGRSGTILEGESGFNDPVGIALMIGMVELATSDGGSFGSEVVAEFLVEMGVGLAVGIGGALLIAAVIRHAPLPDRTLYPLAIILAAGAIYGVAGIAHGSGFLAVLLGFVVRPLVVGPLLVPMRLTWGERGFVVWSGLKGAVPILLASLAVVGGTEYAAEIYGLVFVVVLFSVVVQGTLVPGVAARLGVPMTAVTAETRQSYE